MNTSVQRIGADRYVATGKAPEATSTTLHRLRTSDGADVDGVLRTIRGATTVVCLMHPRQDLTHHAMVPELLARGYAVWTQGTRSVNNDLTLVHEQAILDVAAGQAFLREQGFAHVVTFGHSGGGPLFAFYYQQAALSGGERIANTPAGRATGLRDADMPLPDGAIFMAPHPGQGVLLMRMIDPSVTDEADPLSVDPSLNMFDSVNGFAEPPRNSTYTPEFVEQYRKAQRERIARIDDVARERVQSAAEARRRFAETDDPVDRRRSLAPRVITVYRTDADPRGVDLSLDPNNRHYGSLYGRRPDLTNYGLVGFGRFTTPEAWLSTWSGLSSNADFLRCAPAVTIPTLLIELSGDQAAFPSDIAAMRASLGARDLSVTRVDGTHFGAPIAKDQPTGIALAAGDVDSWLRERYPRA